MLITRSIHEPIRTHLGMEHRWDQEDCGLIWCWERGRIMADADPELAARAKDGELMVLGWRGGLHAALQKPKMDGTLNYLAQWLGLRGENLHIDTEVHTIIYCNKCGTPVTYSKAGGKSVFG